MRRRAWSTPRSGAGWRAGTDIRRATNALLDEIPPEAIDADLGDGGDTLGTVLFHVADAEVFWIHRVFEGRSRDEAIEALLTHQGRAGDDPLTHVTGETLAQHRERMDRVRASVVEVLAPLSNEEFNRVHVLVDQDVSASWMLFHLIDHEWDHTVRIRERSGTRSGSSAAGAGAAAGRYSTFRSRIGFRNLRCISDAYLGDPGRVKPLPADGSESPMQPIRMRESNVDSRGDRAYRADAAPAARPRAPSTAATP